MNLNNEYSVEGLSNALLNLVGARCWAISTNIYSGSTLNFHFGNKIPREKPIPSSQSGSFVAAFKGEFRLLVSCTWRLESKLTVLCASRDSLAADSASRLRLNELIDDVACAIILDEVSLDVSITFESGKVLKVFCDLSTISPSEHNYSFWFWDKFINVAPGLVIRKNQM